MNDPRAYQEFEFKYKNELRSEMATAKNSELEQKKKLKLELTTENPKQSKEIKVPTGTTRRCWNDLS